MQHACTGRCKIDSPVCTGGEASSRAALAAHCEGDGLSPREVGRDLIDQALAETLADQVLLRDQSEHCTESRTLDGAGLLGVVKWLTSTSGTGRGARCGGFSD